MPPQQSSIRKRRRSYNVPGHVHELTWSCHQRAPLLNRDRTCLWLLQALERARKLHSFDVHAYVIMPEHVHVLLRPRQSDHSTSDILKSIKQPVARRAIGFLRANAPQFLERLRVVWPTGRSEYRFWQQGGGYDRSLVDPRTLLAAIDYIHQNPVRRGLVTVATGWVWSSARWYAGLRDGVLRVDDVSMLLQ